MLRQPATPFTVLALVLAVTFGMMALAGAGGGLGLLGMAAGYRTTVDNPAVAASGYFQIDRIARSGRRTLSHFIYSGEMPPAQTLEGTLVDDPAVSSWGDGRLDVFGRDANNALIHRFFDGTGVGGTFSGAWSAWSAVSGPNQIRSAPAAVSWGPDRIDVFARGNSDRLWHLWWDGTEWRGPEDLGGELRDAPAVASRGPQRLDVLARGTDDQLWHKEFNGTEWGEWMPLGGILTSKPAVVSWRSDELDVFARGGNNEMFHKRLTGTGWSDWASLGGDLSSAPAAVQEHERGLSVVARHADNQLRWRSWTPGGWGPWVRWIDGSRWTGTNATATLTVARSANAFVSGPEDLGGPPIACGSSGAAEGALCTATYTKGVDVPLTFTLTPGYVFAGWTGACAGQGQTCTVFLDGSKSVGINIRAE